MTTAPMTAPAAWAPQPMAIPQVAPTVKKSSVSPKRILIALGVVLGLLVGGVAAFAAFVLLTNLRSDAGRTGIAAVTRAPITLHDDTENVPATSYLGLPINLPYDGMVTLDVSVMQGNPVDIAVVPHDGWEDYKASPGTAASIPELSGKKTKALHQTARVPAGHYYVALRDKTLGILSASTSSVHVTAKLAPF